MLNQTFRNNRGQVIGTVKGGFFRKTVSQRKHLMKVMDAWGIAEDVLERLPEHCNIIITDSDTNQVYATHVETYLEKGIRKEFGGYGKQVFLPRKNFNFNEKTLFE